MLLACRNVILSLKYAMPSERACCEGLYDSRDCPNGLYMSHAAGVASICS